MNEAFTEIVRRIDSRRWFDAFEEEYLRDFIPSGGSAVRFLSGSEEVLTSVAERLQESAASKGMWVRLLNPGTTDDGGKPTPLHRIEIFYRSVVAGYDWEEEVDALLRSQLREAGIAVAEDSDLSDIAGLAEENDRDVADLAREVKRLATHMIRDPRMTTEFRLALASLARERTLRDSGTPSLRHVVLEWLESRAVPGGAKILKNTGIYDRIRPLNARAMLASFAHWRQRGTASGTMIVLDLRPYEPKRLNARQRAALRDAALRDAIRAGQTGDDLETIMDASFEEASIYFSDKAFLQMLDLLRHFVDDVEAFPGCVLIVLTSDAFYDERSPRNFYQYNALQTRIAQEVRDAARPNPVAMLSHLQGDA